MPKRLPLKRGEVYLKDWDLEALEALEEIKGWTLDELDSTKIAEMLTGVILKATQEAIEDVLDKNVHASLWLKGGKIMVLVDFEFQEPYSDPNEESFEIEVPLTTDLIAGIDGEESADGLREMAKQLRELADQVEAQAVDTLARR